MGKIVVIEGMDGSGKSTQTKRLYNYLVRQGLRVKQFHFPSGEGFYGDMVNSFLRGEYGDADNVDPYFAAFAFAGNRKETDGRLRKWMREYDIILLDRYTFSNIAYQCAKLRSRKEQRKLSEWIYRLEFRDFGIPKPDISIFMGVPMSFVRHQLMRSRSGSEREYLKGEEDIHEKDISLQYRVASQYRQLCEKYDELVLLECTDENGRMISGDRIHRKIIDMLENYGIIEKNNNRRMLWKTE